MNNNKSKRNKSIFSIIKLIVTVSLLYYVFYRYVNVNDFLTAFRNIRPGLFFVLLVIVFANRYLLAYQTSYYFKKIFDIDLGINFIFKVQMISSFFAFVLPGELAGGLVSWYMLSDKSGKKIDSAAVIIFLRLLSIITMIAFTAIGFVFEEKLESLGLQPYILLTAFYLTAHVYPVLIIKGSYCNNAFFSGRSLKLPLLKNGEIILSN